MLLLSGSAAAELEEIVVTATRSDDFGHYGMPAVALVKQADFLVQNIRLVNDSRSPDLRKQEIVGTIEAMLERARRMRGMALSYGQGFLEPIDLSDDSLRLIEDHDRFDTSYVDIFAKVEFDPAKRPKEQIADLREFISGTDKVGRTEIDPLGDIGLSIVGPEQYRYEIIQKIAAESRKLGGTLAGDCQMSVKGLEGRVEWQRTSLSELTLYIPYEFEVTDCRF